MNADQTAPSTIFQSCLIIQFIDLLLITCLPVLGAFLLLSATANCICKYEDSNRQTHLTLCILVTPKCVYTLANSEDQDEMPHVVVFHKYLFLQVNFYSHILGSCIIFQRIEYSAVPL